MCNSNPCDQVCKKQIAYEKAIDAYQFHVQRYHTWVNYYAIFVGALFVAFYTIIAQTDFEIHYYFMEASKIRSELLLPIIIVLLGWSTSIAWFAKGYTIFCTNSDSCMDICYNLFRNYIGIRLVFINYLFYITSFELFSRKVYP